MNRPTGTLVVLSLACAILAKQDRAGQSSQTATPPSSQSTPQSPTMQAPPTSSSQPADKPDKKVWTNDDVGDLRDHSAISTVGSTDPKKSKPAEKPDHPPKGKETNWYINQIQTLKAKIPPLNDKIQQLEDALSGKQVDTTRQYTWSKPDDWHDQLERLKKQRDDLQTKINELRDQARHDGVPPNILP
jgi:hypothetical protein